jgi:uncharacterized metal-binding protein
LSATHLVLIPSYNTGARLKETVLAALYVGSAVWTIGLIHDRNAIAMALEPLRALLASLVLCCLLFWEGGVPVALDTAVAGAKLMLLDLSRAPLATQVAVASHTVQAALALVLLPLFVQRSAAELKDEAARVKAYQLANEAVFDARTKKHMQVINVEELEALNKKTA